MLLQSVYKILVVNLTRFMSKSMAIINYKCDACMNR